MEATAAVSEFISRVNGIKEQMGHVLVGQDMIIEGVMMCLFGGGHVLLEGVPD
jgi:MoxR-like ATPase